MAMSRSEKIAKDKAGKRINAAFHRTCNGIQINIMDLHKVFDHGEAVIASGADDEELGVKLKAFAESIRAG